MASVSIRHLGKDVGPARILGDVSLEIADGELLVLVGPSGCGKTTLLRCIAGLEAPSRGEIALDGARVDQLQPAARDIAMVFQSYALYPHLSVRENLAFGLKMRKVPRPEIERRVVEAAELLQIAPYLDRLPRALSGGQRQRVAMGRAVVRRPRCFLFDEPLSNLDASLRGQMRVELKRLHARLSATMIYVTHDQVEAMTLADRIAVLRAGVLEQVGPPRALYDRPANLFVARFLGTPEMNAIEGRVVGGRFQADGVSCPVADAPDGACTLGVRAEDLAVERAADGGDGAAGEGAVEVVEMLGADALVHLRTGAGILTARTDAARAPDPGAKVRFRFAPDKVHLFGSDGARLDSGGGLAQGASR
jgi:ABC-type sugar transport system ATPase subunit